MQITFRRSRHLVVAISCLVALSLLFAVGSTNAAKPVKPPTDTEIRMSRLEEAVGLLAGRVTVLEAQVTVLQSSSDDLKQQVEQLSSLVPLTVLTPSDPTTTVASTYVISGSCPSTVRYLTIVRDGEAISTTHPTGCMWSLEVPLEPGENSFAFQARNAAREVIGRGSVPTITRVDAMSPPLLVSPEDRSVAAPGNIALQWSAVGGAIGYDPQVYSSPAAEPTSMVRGPGFVEGLEFVASMHDFTGTYWWRVRAVYPGDIRGPWSELRSFALMVAPSLSSPEDGCVAAPGNITLQWRAVDGAIGYDPQVYSSPAAEATSMVRGPGFVEGLEFVASMHDFTGTYWWRVRAVYPGDIRGPWSELRSFLLD
jgi:hypothetical protein